MAGVKDGREDLTSPLLLASPGGSISATVFSPGGHVKKVEVQSGNDPSGSCLSAILSSTSGSESSEVMLVIQSSVWINFVLMLCKLYTFLVSGSLAVLASLVDSIIDLLGQGALMLTSFLARQSGHEEYPVGRGRLEPVGVMICAVVMGMASMEVISQSSIKLIKYWDRDDAPAAELTETAVVVLVFIVFLKAGLWYWCSNVSKRNPGVDAIKAIAQDNMNDVISNIAALIAPEMIVLGYQFWVIDPLAGIGISIYIIYTWILTGFEQVEMIVGKKADPDFLQKVFSIVEGHDQRMQLDQLSAYHFGPKYLVELEVVMPESTTLRDSHDCGILLQHKIETLEEVERCFVHIDYQMRLHDDHDPEVPIDAKLYGGPCRTSPRAEGAKLTFQRSGELMLKESEPTPP